MSASVRIDNSKELHRKLFLTIKLLTIKIVHTNTEQTL